MSTEVIWCDDPEICPEEQDEMIEGLADEDLAYIYEEWTGAGIEDEPKWKEEIIDRLKLALEDLDNHSDIHRLDVHGRSIYVGVEQTDQSGFISVELVGRAFG